MGFDSPGANSGSLTASQAAQVGKMRGRRRLVDELTERLVAVAPVQSFTHQTVATGTALSTSLLNGFSSISNGVYVPWTDGRFKYLGGTPEAYTNASHQNGYGSVLITDVLGGGSIQALRSGRQWAVEFDFEGQAFEVVEYGNTSQWMNIYVDGRAVWSQPQPQSAIATLTAGDVCLRRVDLGARGQHTIRIVFEAGLFGGIYLAAADTLQPATTGNSLTVQVIGDSYSVNGVNGPSGGTTYRTDQNWVFRMARRLGVSDVWNDGVGGTGVAANNSGGDDKYGDRSSRWAATADLVIVEGSINDSSLIQAASLTQATLQANTQTLLAAVRAKYPSAYIVMTGILRPGNPTSADTQANNAYKAAVAALASDTKLSFVDAIANTWFSGTGKSGSPANDGNADNCLASDGNHPTVEGHRVMGDRIAASIPSGLGLPMEEPVPPATSLALPGLLAPWHPSLNTAKATLTIGSIYGVRVTVTRTGTLNQLSVFVPDTSGNLRIGVYDTGDASVGNRSLLYDSGSVAAPAAGNWKTVTPSIQVYAGQQLDLVVMVDNTTITLARAGVLASTLQQLPSGYFPAAGGASPKMFWSYAAGAYAAFPATISEANCGTTSGVSSPYVMGYVN